MRTAEKYGRLVRPSAVGASLVPADEEAMKVVRQLAHEALEVITSSSSVGCFGAEAIVRWGLGWGPPRLNGTAPRLENRNICERFFALADAHPMGRARLRRAIWLAIVAHQANLRSWGNPRNHWLGTEDPDFVRVCQVAAARMLSRPGKLWAVVPLAGGGPRRAGLVRVTWPDYFLAPIAGVEE